ncbi:AAA family ATPase, partial [Cronobacter muytjensii]|nr:AAA family ATPase [Cronobacter muytjensii]
LNLMNSVQEKTELREKIKNTIIDDIWNRSSYIRKTDCISLVNWASRKQRFFEKIRDHSDSREHDLNDLNKEYHYLMNTKDIRYNQLSKFSLPSISEDDNIILSEPLISSSNSHLSNLITKLSSSDWVRKGLVYLTLDICPFCQQNLDLDNFKKEITKLFDESYATAYEKLLSLNEKYCMWIKKVELIKETLRSYEFIIDPKVYMDCLKEIETLYRNNELLITHKITNPSEIVKCTSEKQLINKLDVLIDGINKSIEDHNSKIDNYDMECVKLENKLLSHLKWLNISSLTNLSSQLDEIDNNIQDLNKQISSLNDENIFLKNKNTENLSQVVNIEETVERINEYLISLGIFNFQLARHDPKSETYKLVRNGEDSTKSIFKSLSEGEKTIVSFLYFMEQCKGLSHRDEVTGNKLIVIDDPISSLSHNYIYEISAMIFNDLIMNEIANKFIILTHNLFFYQELILTAGAEKKEIKSWKFYRLTKNKYSECHLIEKDGLLNDYQSLWQVLKDAKAGRVSPVILPNVMRNILEYYFSFSCKKERLKEVIRELASKHSEPRYNSFYRFINRQSHSDGRNIHILGSIEASVYIDMFEKIFEDTGDHEHFKAMIDSKD